MPITSPHLAGFSTEISALSASAQPSLVAIVHKRHSISGFYWQPDVVATVSEPFAAKRGDIVSIHTHGGKTFEGSVIGHDPGTDLALIRVLAAGVTLPASALSSVSLGQAVVALGRTPHGATAALGFATLVGGAWRSMRGGDLTQRVWLDASMPRSAEGSAVLDTSGGLLGMAVFGPRRRVVLIPADTMARAGSELMQHGRIRRGYLGVSVQPVTMPATGSQSAAAVGLMVMALDDKGPAAAAGLMRGDIITAVDGKAPQSARALQRLLPGTTIGQSKAIELVRAGQTTQLSVMIGEHAHQ